MHIERVDLADADTIRACFQVFLAAQQVDEPDGPWFTEQPFRGWLTVGWGGDPREVWMVPGPEGDSVAGWYKLELPDLENLDQAELMLVVHPAWRRHGLGRALLQHAAARAAEHGRTVLNSGTRRGTGSENFARAMGADPGLVDVQRVMDARAMTDEQLARLRETAAQAAAGYSLVSWTGLVPEDFLKQAAALFAALNDAPHDPHIAPAVWDAQRVRERVNDLRPHYGLRTYAIAAVQEDTGKPAALTEVAVDPADPGWGHQMITGVTREHRGHRLGLLVKTAMVQWLRTAEPALERIHTWNAESNRYMIAVNEALGYTILGQPANWWRLEVPAVLGEQALAGPSGGRRQALACARQLSDHADKRARVKRLRHEALLHARRALDLGRETGSLLLTADTLDVLGRIHLGLGDTAAARDSWQQALTIRASMPNADDQPVRARLAQLG